MQLLGHDVPSILRGEYPEVMRVHSIVDKAKSDMGAAQQFPKRVPWYQPQLGGQSCTHIMPWPASEADKHPFATSAHRTPAVHVVLTLLLCVLAQLCYASRDSN